MSATAGSSSRRPDVPKPMTSTRKCSDWRVLRVLRSDAPHDAPSEGAPPPPVTPHQHSDPGSDGKPRQ